MTPDPARGALWAVLAVGCFSANDILIKLLSGGYALHELVFIRTVIGLCVVLGAIAEKLGDRVAIIMGAVL